jgi:putative membrane protein
LVVWGALAIAPRYRADWALENIPTLIGVPAAVYGYRFFRFSNQAYIQATILLILHTIGSHYTYSEVPIGHWFRAAAGWDRNHYDRLVHFLFGVLLLRPVRELGFRHATIGRAASSYFSVAAIAWWSVSYEIVEWLVARTADPAAGIAYLGTQGDEWDAQKDMALALAGASLAAVFEWRSDRQPMPRQPSDGREVMRPDVAT